MGCSSQAVVVEPIRIGEGLTKEKYQGVMSKACADEQGSYKWYCKFHEWMGKQIMTREGIMANRKEYNDWLSQPNKHKAFQGDMGKCDQTTFTIKGADGNDMEVYQVKSKANKDKTGLAMVVNFHGGGAYLGHPSFDFHLVAKWAAEHDIVIFSVGYRLAPEVQYPTSHKDGKAAIEYFLENGEKHGGDPARLCVHGSSGGGWITMGALTLMAREDEEKVSKVKLMVLTCPMLGDHVIVMKREEVEEWERGIWPFRADDFMMHSDNLERDKDDPLLFPGKLGVEEMKKLPKCVLQTSEFDFIRRDVHNVIPKMKEAGIYLDHMDYSAVGHGFQMMGDEPKHKVWQKDMKECWEKYLLN